ncbi:caspase, EACC1-associated type [Streptomyces sp. NPDC002143]
MSQRDDIDFGRSRAILLGTSRYTAGFADRSPMPAASESLKEMRRLLTGPGEWPKGRITTFKDRRDSGKLLREMTELIGDVEDVLLFYYVGHGQPLFGSNHQVDLGLALTDTSEDVPQRALTSLRFRDVREQVERNSKARIKILILDCCCAGLATREVESGATPSAHAENAHSSRGAGTYIWAACGHTQRTFFEQEEGGLTYFTKFLSEAVREAHGEQSLGATVAHLHEDVARRLRDASVQNAISNAGVPPVPDLHYSGRPDQFLFVRGQAAVRGGAEYRFESLKEGDPRKVGPYELRARLGAGGVGRVYLAFPPAGQSVAVKVLRADLGQDPEFGDRFAREVDLLWKVDSSRVARLVDAHPKAAEPWLASTYVCGPSLQELVREAGPLPDREVLLIASGIAQALKDIHKVRVVHRDLKPANIMLDETGPKIIDFGIAKSVATTLMVRTNVQLGTPAYRSPEQVSGRAKITGKSDVFTLGSTLYFLATGKDAFTAEDPLGMINLIANEEPDLSVLGAEVRELVRRCMRKDPAERPTPEEVVEICEAATGTVAPGAYLPVQKAAPAIHARNQALRRLMQAHDVVNRPATTTPTPTPTPPEPEPEPSGTPGPPPPEPGPGPGRSGSRGALAALAVLVCAVLLVWLPNHFADSSSDDDAHGSTASSSDTYTGPDTSPDDETSDDPTTDPVETPTPTPTPTPSPTPTSPMETAGEGDCLANDGTYAKPELEPSDCKNGVFKVMKALDGTSDTAECAGVADVDYPVSNAYVNRVLCLSYQAGTAYHAVAGQCVYGPNSRGSNWARRDCVTGNFTVKARLTGTDDTSRCGPYSNVEQTLSSTAAWSELNVVQCLSMNFPDAAGRAVVGSCLLATGTPGHLEFQAASCSRANAVVMGRVARYYDSPYCGSYPLTTWRSSDFPEIAYTVCFKRV